MNRSSPGRADIQEGAGEPRRVLECERPLPLSPVARQYVFGKTQAVKSRIALFSRREHRGSSPPPRSCATLDCTPATIGRRARS